MEAKLLQVGEDKDLSGIPGRRWARVTDDFNGQREGASAAA